MEEEMLDKSTPIAQQIDAGVKELLSQLATASSTIASQSQTISQLQQQLQNDATAADDANVALLTPIASEIAAALPPAQS
jgi:hypothetical protein